MPIFKSKKNKNEEKKVFLSFSETVRNNIKNYTGPHSQILKFAPDFFDLIVKLYKKDMPSPYRDMINSTISYFVLPDDILPEETLGAFGYLDDLYICAYVVKKFKENKNLAKIVEELWAQPQNVFVVSDHIIEELENTSEADLKEAISSILIFTGIADLEDSIKKEAKQYVCSYCEKIYETKELLNDHIENEHEEKPEEEESLVQIDVELDASSLNVVEEILERAELELRESDTINEELRKISFSKPVIEVYKNEKRLEDDENLLQNAIPAYLILHMVKKAKYNNILTKRDRKALFDIASRKMKYRKLSDKQVEYLGVLLNKMISRGIVETPCEDEPCDHCEKLKEIMEEYTIRKKPRDDKKSSEAVVCPYCKLKFSNQSYLEQHIKKRHKNKV